MANILARTEKTHFIQARSSYAIEAKSPPLPSPIEVSDALQAHYSYSDKDGDKGWFINDFKIETEGALTRGSIMAVLTDYSELN